MKSEGGGRDTDAAHLQVGARIRHARILKGMRMRDLALAVGCDESMISKIEAGKVTPSLAMLNKIVVALDRDMASFFGLEIDDHKLVQTPADRIKVEGDALRGGKGVFYERLVPLAAGNLLEANIHNVEPGGEKSDPITHQGEAVGYLLEGEIDLLIDGTTYHMRQATRSSSRRISPTATATPARPWRASSGSTRRRFTERRRRARRSPRRGGRRRGFRRAARRSGRSAPAALDRERTAAVEQAGMRRQVDRAHRLAARAPAAGRAPGVAATSARV